ncbi:MAG: type II restriction endonuclease [Bacilli bacterium]
MENKDLLINLFSAKAKLNSFEILGLFARQNVVISLGSDSKLIGRIFELLTFNILEDICRTLNWRLEETESQTVYPDFTIFTPNGKIAVDVKTTYRKYTNNNQISPYNFTLGSYASFLRNGTKNIAYHYNEYIKHYVIGFVYDRVNGTRPGTINSIYDQILPPYRNVEYFMQEKYKIAGDKPGSGNTENIGTFKSSNINDFINGNGPFSTLGNSVFEDYWRNYPKYRENDIKFRNLQEYFVYKQTH